MLPQSILLLHTRITAQHQEQALLQDKGVETYIQMKACGPKKQARIAILKFSKIDFNPPKNNQRNRNVLYIPQRNNITKDDIVILIIFA